MFNIFLLSLPIFSFLDGFSRWSFDAESFQTIFRSNTALLKLPLSASDLGIPPARGYGTLRGRKGSCGARQPRGRQPRGSALARAAGGWCSAALGLLCIETVGFLFSIIFLRMQLCQESKQLLRNSKVIPILLCCGCLLG